MLSVESVTQLDTSGIQALEERHSELKAEGMQLLVARPKLYMRRYGESTGIGLRVGREKVSPRCERPSRRCWRVRGAAMGSRRRSVEWVLPRVFRQPAAQ